MSLHLAIVVADTHAPGARQDDIRSDVEHVLLPLLDSLEARTSTRIALHLSQTLLDHLTEAWPEVLPRLQALAKKKQIRFLCSTIRGGLPWLGLERDGVGQLKQHRAQLEQLGPGPVRGAWPVGFAWDPSWPRFLGRVGLRYTLCSIRALVAGGAAVPVRSWVKVRAESHRAVLLPFDADLLHRIPHAPPEAIAQALREHAERGVEAQVLVLPMARLSRWGADIEGQYLRELFQTLFQQGGWLRVVAPELLMERTPCAGLVHPPASTPLHVGVGALAEVPGRRLLDTADALVLRRDLVLKSMAPGLVGPPLDAFLHAWPAAGALVDRASRVSQALAALRRRAARDKALHKSVLRATRALHQGSSSGTLWDGDGGLVGEPAARWAAWTSLIEAEDIVWEARDPSAGPEVEVPADGGPVHLRTGTLVASIDPVGGAVTELSVRGLGNIVNILTPRPRPWSDRLGDLSLPCLVPDEAHEAQDDLERDDSTEPPTDDGEPRELRESRAWSPVHDSARGLGEFDHPLALFQDFLLPEGTSTEALALGMAGEQGDFASGDWRVERTSAEEGDVDVLLVREGTVGGSSQRQGMVQVTKRLRFRGDAPTVSVRWSIVNRSRETVRTRLGVVIPINLDGGVGAERTLHLPGTLPRPHDAQGEADGVADFALRYGDRSVLIRARPDGPVRVNHFPLVAPVRRRQGHVGVFQGTVAILSWPLELWGHETREYGLVLEIHQR